MTMDIEDAGLAREAQCADVLGYISDSDDADAIQEEVELQDYLIARDLLGDFTGSAADPAQVNPLTFVPQTPGDFDALKTKICDIGRALAPDLRVLFATAVIQSLARKCRRRHLLDLADRVRAFSVL
jgi:hypothetical protein